MHDTAVEDSGTPAANDEPAALTVPEAARKLGISERRTWLMVKTGELRSFKVGSKMRRIPVEEIPAYIARQIASERVA